VRVVYVITRSDVMGGASIHLLDLAKGVQSRGHNVTILVGGEGIVVDRAREKGLPCVPLRYLVREISLFRDLRCYFEIKAHFEALGPDLVHLHSAKAGILGRIAASALEIPAVYTAHGWAFTEGVSASSRRLYAFVEQHMARFSSQIITVSDYDRRLALNTGVGTPGLITTVHNGIPDAPNVVHGYDSDPSAGRVRLIMVARFEQQKDHELLVNALASLAGLEWELELVGDGPNLESVRELVNGFGLNDKVEFTGARHDVPQRIQRADVLVLTSRWEGLPLTILEGMRAGLPVVASDVGGVRESVEHGRTGYLVPRAGLKELEAALRQLIASPELRREMGLKGRKRFEEEFTFEHMLDGTLQVYEGVLRA